MKVLFLLLFLLGACNTERNVANDGAVTDAAYPDAVNMEGQTVDAKTDSPCTEEDFPPQNISDDGYHRFELCQWTIYMHDDLFRDPLGKDVFSALSEDLGIISNVLPSKSLEFLYNTPIWLELNESEFPGGVYHPSADWLIENSYPVKWAKGIQLGNASNYLTWVNEQPAMVLHEFAHAFYDQKFSGVNPDVLDAYESALALGIYDSVRYVNGQLREAYAKTNVLEYFAELTEAYYWSNDFYPFTRSELETHDARGTSALVAAWDSL